MHQGTSSRATRLVPPCRFSSQAPPARWPHGHPIPTLCYTLPHTTHYRIPRATCHHVQRTGMLPTACHMPLHATHHIPRPYCGDSTCHRAARNAPHTAHCTALTIHTTHHTTYHTRHWHSTGHPNPTVSFGGALRMIPPTIFAEVYPVHLTVVLADLVCIVWHSHM